MATAQDIRMLAEPTLRDVGLQLWDVEVSRDIVRILVERDGGVDLEALTTASEAISTLLDEHDELVPEDRYQLEISSPGLERSLRTAEQYDRYVGTTVSVKTLVAVGGGRRHRGVLVGVDADGIELLADTNPKGPPLALSFDQIDRTLTVVDWALALKAGDPAPAADVRPSAPSGRDDAAAARIAGPARDTKDLTR
jgi:ribosome maturation factor RimP